MSDKYNNERAGEGEFPVLVQILVFNVIRKTMMIVRMIIDQHSRGKKLASLVSKRHSKKMNTDSCSNNNSNFPLISPLPTPFHPSTPYSLILLLVLLIRLRHWRIYNERFPKATSSTKTLNANNI